MYLSIKKKVIQLASKLIGFIKNNKLKTSILVFLFVFLEAIKSLPYINLIPNYQFFIIGLLIFLLTIFFNTIITTSRLIMIVMVLFAIAAITTLLKMPGISDLMGFIIFVLLTLLTLQQIVRDRDELRK